LIAYYLPQLIIKADFANSNGAKIATDNYIGRLFEAVNSIMSSGENMIEKVQSMKYEDIKRAVKYLRFSR
jgi:hypothetical protein